MLARLLSDSRGANVAGLPLMRLFLSLIPKGLGYGVKKAAHFAVNDVAKV
jgi:hypothetical protein